MAGAPHSPGVGSDGPGGGEVPAPAGAPSLAHRLPRQATGLIPYRAEIAGTDLQRLLASSFEYYADRTTRRLSGLTDDEYFWEPVPGCWSVRPGPDGTLADWSWPPPDPPPVTTIAWRTVHICSFLQEHGMRAVAFERGKAAWGPPTVIPDSAAEALAALAAAVEAWKRDLASVDDDRLWEPMGPEAGAFAENPVAGFVEHIHDEFIHHSAEIALLRDLYRAGGTVTVASSRTLS